MTNLVVVNADYNQRLLKETQPFPIDNNNSSLLRQKDFLSNYSSIFTKNCGQLENEDVRFYSQDGSVWFTDSGVWFEICEKVDSTESIVESQNPDLLLDPWEEFESPKPVKQKRLIIKQEFVNANCVTPRGRSRASWNSNFFYGNDSSKWCANVPNFQEVYFENLYDGIDLRYYSNENGLKYDFIVHPGANPNQIRVKYNGIDKISQNNYYDIIIQTKFGAIVDKDLFIFQKHDTCKIEVLGRFELYSNFEYGFKILGEYQQNKILIIDPSINLEYATYIGKNNSDYPTSVTVDIIGNAYITGTTRSNDFITTPGAFDKVLNGSYDIFVLKLNWNGSDILFSTFIGGKHLDRSGNIEIDSMENVIIAGQTESSDFPTTKGVYDTLYNGPDIFVLKLNNTGSSLLFSTFIGGNNGEFASDFAIDNSNNIYITGSTISPNFPTTPNAYNTSYSGTLDSFSLKLNSNGSKILYSTFIGGSDEEWGRKIIIDKLGNAIISGETYSTDFPTTPDANITVLMGRYDLFILKINQNGSKLIFSTLIGGWNYERVESITLDNDENIYATGWTVSTDFPTTSDAYNRTYKGVYDGIIIKFNYNGSKLLYSSYFGGNSQDNVKNLMIDNNYIIITGYTRSDDFPIIEGGHSDSLMGVSDFFISKFTLNFSYLIYSTFIGGSGNEGSVTSTLDSVGNIYLVGSSNSSDLPTTPGAYKSNYSGGGDIYAFKVSFKRLLNITSVFLLENNRSTEVIYSKYNKYKFIINITDTISLFDLKEIMLILDPDNSNIQLCWDRIKWDFFEVADINDYVSIDSMSRARFYKNNNWTIEFDLTFNWTYPNEEFQDIQVKASSWTISPAWWNETDKFRVENDLEFNGTLLIQNKEGKRIIDGGLVRGGEILNWTGLKVVYEGATDIYPPENEYNLSIWDKSNNSWSDSPGEGENLTIQTIANSKTDIDGNIHIINISGIPPGCDKSNCSFIIRIDGDNVTFSQPKPNNKTWQTSKSVDTGVTITDLGGGEVDGERVFYSISKNNGDTWSDWAQIPAIENDVTINIEAETVFQDGGNNLIKWKALDTLGNGPVESDEYRILVDSKNVKFSNPIPSDSYISTSRNVTVGITIIDIGSGVNGSTIQYSVSNDSGINWNPWELAPFQNNDNNVNVELNLNLPDRKENMIKWRAKDLAGNGPKESNAYIINVIIPKVKLLSPSNGSVIDINSVVLTWKQSKYFFEDIEYDLFFDTNKTPNIYERNITNTEIFIDDLIYGATYYWQVIPIANYQDEGICLSGIWLLSVEIPIPKVKLSSPENRSIIESNITSLIWELDYYGLESVVFDIYLDTIDNPELKINEHDTLSYTPELIHGETYYWKVVPKIGNTTGIGSRIWWFKVKVKDFKPRFELKLTLETSFIELKQGELKLIIANVTNLGNTKDLVSVKSFVVSGTGINTSIGLSNFLFIRPGASASYLVMIIASEDASLGEKKINITARSENATKYNLEIGDSTDLNINVMAKDKTEGPKTDTSTQLVLISFLFLIIILIFIVGSFLFVKRKKKKVEDKEQKEEPETPKQELLVKPVSLEEKQPAFGTIPQPPSISSISTQEPLITSTMAQPQLPSTDTGTPVPEIKQILEKTQLPQLPPMEKGTKNDK
jgi:hypothetical protein